MIVFQVFLIFILSALNDGQGNSVPTPLTRTFTVELPFDSLQNFVSQDGKPMAVTVQVNLNGNFKDLAVGDAVLKCSMYSDSEIDYAKRFLRGDGSLTPGGTYYDIGFSVCGGHVFEGDSIDTLYLHKTHGRAGGSQEVCLVSRITAIKCGHTPLN